VRFSDREEVEPITRDVKVGILRHVSVGFTVERIEKVEEVDDIPVYRATAWTPAKISLFPLAFDDGAVVRGLDLNPTAGGAGGGGVGRRGEGGVACERRLLRAAATVRWCSVSWPSGV
jgi:hypothetical protein